MHTKKKKVKLNEVRRVILFSYDKEKEIVEIRHYVIEVKPAAVSRTVRKLIRTKIPNLANYEDISDFIVK